MVRWQNQGESDVDNFVAIITATLGYDSRDVEQVVRAFLKLLIEGLEHGKGVQFRNFGKLKVVKRKGTRRWDFKQHKVVETGPWYSVKYEPSENIKKALRKLQENA